MGNLANLSLDVDQKGWGFTPLVSLAFHQGPFTLTARYEFRTKIETKNETNSLNADLNTTKLVTEPLTQLVVAGAISAEQAQAIGQGIQQKMGGGFSAYTAPYEDGAKTRYDMPALLSVAAGFEFTPKLRATVEYQQNTSFACDSYSVGLGGAWNINEKVRLNAGYFCSIYSDYEKQATYGLETYSRTNHVIGLGIDYKF